MSPIKVLFICMGNICRSPTAHAVFRQRVAGRALQDKIYVDSAGTHAYHVGCGADTRSQQAALLRGFKMDDLQARQLCAKDYQQFDYLLVADHDNFRLTFDACPVEQRHKIGYILDYAKNSTIKEVPDPYYGEGDGFEKVLDLLEDACEGLLLELEKDIALD